MARRDVQPALAAGVVQVDDRGQIRFSHPLLASVASSALLLNERSRLHRRLAELTDDVEERAGHLVAAGAAANDLDTLDAGAHRAWLRGAPETAAELAERALAIVPPERVGELPARQLRAAQYHFDAGDGGRARELLEVVATAVPPGPARAEVLWRIGRVRWHVDSTHAAITVFRDALAEAGDPHIRAALNRDLALALINTGQVPQAADHARVAINLAEQVADPILLNQARAPLALVEFFSGNGVQADLVAGTRDDLPADDLPVGLRPNVLVGGILKWSDQFESARARLEAEYRRAVARGAEHELPGLLWSMSELECWTGHWKVAARYAEAGVEAATLSGSQAGRALAFYARTLIRVCQGRVEAARQDAEAALKAAQASDLQPVAAWTRGALGFLELSLGNAAAAHTWLAPLVEVVAAMGVREPGAVRFLPDELEALVAMGEYERAERLLIPFEERARALGRVWAMATGARCRGLLLAATHDLDAALHALDAAVREHARLTMPLELGRTLLVKGQLHRRRREKRLAKETLEEAILLFDSLGARLWAEHARIELGRIGLRPPSPNELSATEEQVARLAAAGLTNREIADRLFLSTRSVDGVVARVYNKLGIRTRAQLGSLMAARGVNKDP